MRILVLSHGHPELSPGGAERAAYSLFERLKTAAGVTHATFAAAAEQESIGHDAAFGSFRGRSDEILVAPPPVDGFTFQSFGYDALKRLVDELVQAIRPDIVHIHHFIFWGLEVFELFKKAGVRVVFTLHEYAVICSHYGQMVKPNGRLCHESSPAECSSCLPSISAGKFFVRSTIAKSLLSFVDQFVSPSRFLKERFIAWGLPSDRIAVIENLLSSELLSRYKAKASTEPLQGSWLSSQDRRPIIFGFFGQVTPFKGVDVLLEAAAILPADVRKNVVIRLYGENRHYTETEFHKRTQALLQGVRDVVSPMGGYRGEDVLELMSSCDVIIIPSVWWENSPIVIQEARLAGRPIISANIGGMIEKIDLNVDHTFPVGSPGALASQIADIVREKSFSDLAILEKLARSRAEEDENYLRAHRRLYEDVLHCRP